jgi:trehalose/maltose transport system substrate-binding protein
MAYPGSTVVARVLKCWLRLAPRRVRSIAFAAICLLVLFSMQACKKTNQPAPGMTLTLIDQGWANKDFQRRLNEELALFTSQSGIRVQVLPAPEAAVEQLETWRKLLEGGAAVPDVYGIDVIWPGILADNLIDLKPYIPEQEIAVYFPELIANNTVNGRLVALPSNLNEGLLYYRVDLLQKYEYRAPPRSWQELEVIAKRIQAGERAKGNKDFWGFVWQGARSEALTCNALEWQVSEGGGTILDKNGRVTVNNPQTIRAWSRAARWVGSISPPGVVAYKEWDALNIWQAGDAAFMRNWPGAYIASRAEHSPTKDRFDIAPLPKGSAGIAGTLGGTGYGVSRHSRHPREAAMLVRFLCGRDEQVRRSRNTAEVPSIPQLFDDPEVLVQNPQFSRVLEVFRKGAASRPSTSAGKIYPDVSRAYFEAVHTVLTGKKPASQAAAELQGELTRMLKAPANDANTHFD